ncbi:MAG: hypothetical protein HQ503_08235 [Rhodospirillales bacterium]|nr:hypothetical protein [Rhodospirillales bacterium]
MAAVLAAAAGGVPTPVQAQERVQLQVFMVKVIVPRKKKAQQLPITVYIDALDSEASRYICAINPRIRAAILQRLRNQKFPMDRKGKINIKPIAQEILPIIRKSIGRDIVLDVEVKQGAPKVGSGGAHLFARTGCISVVDKKK